MAKGYYASRISPHRGKTEEGFLVCSGVPVARTGFQFYGEGEIDFKPSKVKPEGGGYNVFRSDEEVFSDFTLSSLEGKPITDDHPSEFVTSENYQVYAKGNVKNARRGEGDLNDFILADLVIWDRDLIDKVEAGKNAVSVGYCCDYEETEKGLSQKNIIANHVAIVSEGRAGDRAIIRDNSPNFIKEADMAEEIKEEKEEKKEEIEQKDECGPEKVKDEPDLVEVLEMVKDLAERVGRIEAERAGDKKTGLDELEEEIFKEREEAFDEDAGCGKEKAEDSARTFFRLIKPHIAKIKDAKEKDKVIKSFRAFMGDSKKTKKTVYAGLVQKDAPIMEEANPYEKIFASFNRK